jgi:NADPH:quinone reductase-like Zn-dependent oxidoreductase
LVLKPANITFDQAAAVPVAAVTALQALRDKGHVQLGQKVLINGASGGLGTFAVQIAKSFGTEVTTVCSTKNLDNARMMGADRVVDYTQKDVTKSGQSHDLIVQVNGYHSILDYRRALSPEGIYVQAGGSKVMLGLFEAIFLGGLISMTGSKKMGFMGIAKMN